MKKITKLIITIISFIILDNIGSAILLEGINRNYGLNLKSKIFIVGHSHMMMGTDKQRIENKLNCKVTKYTRSGVTIDQRKLMTIQYLNSKYSDSLKVALIGVDCFTLSESNISTNSYTLFFPFYDDKNIDNYIKKNASWLEYYQHKLFKLTRYGDDLINLSFRGWINDDKNYKTSAIDINEFEKQRDKWKSKIELRKDLKNELESIIRELTDRGIKVYLVNTPTLDKINHVYLNEYNKVISYYHKLANSNSLVEFIDFNPQYESDYSIFFDPLHLNIKGQQIITDSIINILTKNKDFDFNETCISNNSTH